MNHTEPIGHSDTMKATCRAASSPLGVARKPLGCAVFPGGPFKPISKGFALFFEALLSTIALTNADAMETVAHMDIAAGTPISVTEDADFAKLTSGDAGNPDVTIASPIEDAVPADNLQVQIVEEANTVISNTDAPVAAESHLTADNVPETPISQQEDIPAVAGDPIVDEVAECGLVTGDVPDEDALTTEESVPAACAEDTLDVAEDAVTVSTPVDNDTCVFDEVPVGAIEIMEDDNVLNPAAHNDDVKEEITTFTTPALESVTDDTSVADDIVASATEVNAEVASHEAFSTPAGLDEDETALQQVAEEHLFEDDEENVEEDIEDVLEYSDLAELEEVLNEDIKDAVQDSDGHDENMSQIDPEKLVDNEPAEAVELPISTLPLIFEDDFDAPISSIFDTDFERHLDIDFTWSIPKIIEKGELEREALRERLAKKSKAQFSLQNLFLEKAARILSIDGTAPVQVATKVTTLAAEPASLVLSKKATKPTPKTQSGTDEPAASSRNHSRSASGSSKQSNDSVGETFDSAPCPGTPKIVATYPVPICHDLEYAVLENGQIVYHYFDYPVTSPLTRADYEQYEAAYPFGPKMDGSFFDVYKDEVAETLSDTSSEFISDPDDDEEPIYQAESPFKRPSNPEPPSPSEGDGYYPEDELPRCPSSPYRHRESYYSWTGLDLSPWASHSLITSTGHMALHNEREIQSGSSHGCLHHCRFGLWESPDQVQPAPAPGVPELKLTTPEGTELWPDDCFDRYSYTYEFEYNPDEDWRYGHRCGEQCFEYYSEFGGESYDDLADDGTMDGLMMELERSEADECARAEALIRFHMEDNEEAIDDSEDVDPPPTPKVKRTINPPKKRPSKKGKRIEFVPHRLSVIMEVDEENLDNDSSLDVEPFGEDFLDQLEAAVHQECERRQKEIAATAVQEEGDETEEEKSDGAEKEQLPLWVRDPFYISGKNWEDLMGEEEEGDASDGVQKKEELPLWVRDPFYVSGKNWEDLMDEDE
ncbi:hypothetical protein C8A03DRAFT_18751 [Achaetomium macrosporum]|uniref:Uncharacterized protein n=1 Tax=Achaetomium macrosporum TaxID=79813 RepID=A0AAN7HAQ5_9PEZI|nr:hypothetical protein C8A03DRAFT_18751 [Achaetomium macrosporum]